MSDWRPVRRDGNTTYWESMMDPESPPQIGHNRLAAIDPEKLLVLDVEEIAPLLALQYTDLARRTKELETRANEWTDAHSDVSSRVSITDDADLAKLTDLYNQVRDHAAPKGELDETRERVKAGPLAAGRVIDAHFSARRSALEKWLADVTGWQKTYIREKQATARRHFEEPEKTTVRSTIGSTTSASTVWAFEVTDMMKVCMAIVAGHVPVACIQPNESAIRAAIRAKPPLRNRPDHDIGLRIYEDVQIRRRG
jgi:hypothetical protein